MLCYIIENILSVILLMLDVLVGVAYLTLLERKFLSYIQSRKGPNKVGFIGFFQPFSDAIKLFSKEEFYISKSSIKLFYVAPVMSMGMLLSIWMVYPYHTNIYFLNYSILIMVLILSLNSYMIMFMGWASNSFYSMIGTMRCIAQILSYEVSFIMIILVQMILSESYSLIDVMKWQSYLSYMWMLMPMMVVFLISILAELNRSPMDFIEGESELVSGFNVEYYSGLFALIFMSEYGMIIFMSMMVSTLFVGGGWCVIYLNRSYVVCQFFFSITVIITLVIFMRGILPRMRYDELMYLCWKIILPLVLNYLIYFMMFKSVFMLMVFKWNKFMEI